MRRLTILVLTIAVTAAGVSGCAAFGKKASPEELVMQQAQAFAADFVAGNADKILDYVSEDFSSEYVADKAELADHLQEARDSGKVEEYAQMIQEYHGKIGLTKAKVTVDKDTASVYPIDASADLGAVTVELLFKIDPDKVWRISGINIEGI